MKCKYCKWRGSFREYGGHMSKKHRRILLKNLKKARRAPRSRKSHEGRKSKSQRKSRRKSQHSLTADLPDAPAGFVVETVTYRRA